MAVVEQLAVEGLQSDARFVEAFVHGRVDQGKGPVRIRAELAERGIPAAVADEALAESGEDWRALYRFTQEEKSFDDFQAMNDTISNDPRFRENLAAARADKGRRFGLRNARFTTHVTGEPSESRMLGSVAEMRDVLTNVFGINLPSTDRLDPALESVLNKEPT